MYDRNGLQLTPISHTMNSYRLTSVDLTHKKFTAYAQATQSKLEFCMFAIKKYDDTRDAAFIAQEFEKMYSKDQIRTMATDGIFREITKDFLKNTEIPAWSFPAEGLSIEEILGEGYKTNRVEGPKEALVEAIQLKKMKAPNLRDAKILIQKVQEPYDTKKITYREAAKQVLSS